MSTILIIEREAKWSNIICQALHKARYDTITAINGEDALKLLSIHQPDIVLVEEYVLKMCGENYCQSLKEKHVTHTVPILVHTHIPPSVTDQKSHIDFILDQPTVLPDLLSRIDQLLRPAVQFA